MENQNCDCFYVALYGEKYKCFEPCGGCDNAYFMVIKEDETHDLD